MAHFWRLSKVEVGLTLQDDLRRARWLRNHIRFFFFLMIGPPPRSPLFPSPPLSRSIARAAQSPSAAETEFPLPKAAERFSRTGPPLLQRYLPFWLANLIDRMWVALFSIVAV